MAHRISVILGTALSLPLSLDKQEKGEALERSLRPLIKALAEFKHIYSTIALSGHLLDWCAKHRREYIQTLKELVKQKRVELLGGGYYDPILPLIPRTDGVAQIEQTSATISRLCRRRPRGAWMNQLLWDSPLSALLHTCDMEYTFLKEIDCMYASDSAQTSDLAPVPMPLITEHGGRSVVVFPIADYLCQLWREHKFRALINELRGIHARSSAADLTVVTLFDDSEEQRSAPFLHRFFQLLTNHNDWIETICPGSIPRNRYALHTTHCHSRELQRLRYTIGQQSEIRHIYAAMHHHHNLFSQLRGDKQLKRFAQELVLQGQNYYSFMTQSECRYNTQAQRKYAYGLFIEAAALFYREKQNRPTITSLDYDFDGVTEFLFHNDKMSAIVHRQGGTMTALNLLSRKWSWLDMPSADNVPNRILPHASGLKSQAALRDCHIDYLIPYKNISHTFLNSRIHPYALARNLYTVAGIDHDQSAIHLQTEVALQNGAGVLHINLNKSFRFTGSTIVVNYRLQNTRDVAGKAVFATQFNLNPSLRHFHDVAVEYVDLSNRSQLVPVGKIFSRLNEVNTVHIRSPRERQSLSCNCAGSDTLFLYRFRERRAIVIVPCWNLLLGPQDSRSLQVVLELGTLSA